MLTTGFKTFFAWSAAFFVAAVVLGYTTGGSSVGPVSFGWLGGVGNHIGYSVLMSASAICLVLACVLVAFRDADADAAASYLHLAEAPVGQRPTQPSFWPLVAAFGAALFLIGLVNSQVLFVIGIVLMVVAAIEWTMTAWADAATGDPEANKELRDRVMGPIEIPVLGFAAVGILVVAMSRIFISVSATAAVWIAMGVAAVIFFTAVLFALRPNISRGVIVGACLVGGVAILAGGVVAGVAGEREFEHEEEHSEGEEHSEDDAEGEEHSETDDDGEEHSESEAEATE